MVLFAIACFVLGIQKQDLVEIETGYRAAMAKVPGDIVFDAGQKPKQSFGGPVEPTILGLKQYATKRGRVFERVSGIILFRYPRAEEASNVNMAAIEALASLSDDQLERVFGSGLPINELQGNARDTLIAAIATSPEVASELANGGGRALVKVAFGAVARYQDSSGQWGQASIYAGNTRFSSRAIQEAEARHLPTPPPTPLTAEKSDAGPLDLAKGRLMSVSEITDLAGRTFSTYYDVDPRIADDMCFVRGTFSKPGFEGAFASLLRTRPFAERSTQARFEQVTKQRLADFANKTPYQLVPDLETLMKYPSYSAGELQALGGEAGDFIKHMHLDSSSRVNLIPTIYFGVDGGTPATTYTLRVDSVRQ